MQGVSRDLLTEQSRIGPSNAFTLHRLNHNAAVTVTRYAREDALSPRKVLFQYLLGYSFENCCETTTMILPILIDGDAVSLTNAGGPGALDGRDGVDSRAHCSRGERSEGNDPRPAAIPPRRVPHLCRLQGDPGGSGRGDGNSAARVWVVR